MSDRSKHSIEYWQRTVAEEAAMERRMRAAGASQEEIDKELDRLYAQQLAQFNERIRVYGDCR